MIPLVKGNFYIISGGPGAGKTSLFNALTSKGIAYIPETAREIIKERLSQSLSPRPDPAEFALKIEEDDVKVNYPTLYLNIAKDYEDLNDFNNAWINYQLALAYLLFLPDNGYRHMISAGIREGIQRQSALQQDR